VFGVIVAFTGECSFSIQRRRKESEATWDFSDLEFHLTVTRPGIATRRN